MRAFFAVDLPDSLADSLADVQADLDAAAGIAVTDPSQAHVTLKFCGEIDDRNGDDADRGDPAAAGPVLDDVVAAGEHAVERAGGSPFDCSVAGLGVFPSHEYISVVWAGVDDGAAELTALHDALEAETTALGVAPADHAFTPHVTLARMTDARGKALVQRVVRDRDPEIGSFTVDEIRLVESTLTEDGPVYEAVASFAL